VALFGWYLLAVNMFAELDLPDCFAGCGFEYRDLRGIARGWRARSEY
jgi:hypothetical protein